MGLILVSILFKNPSKQTNIVFEHRTIMLMKDKDVWMFTYNYCKEI